ncbi:hypothetical protein [Planctellipticum variicoloris]|uniref:hypothetical protein n=1 Tax=Planctellipticum variicoloris TaxID=3064265 RepID=UPI003013CE91|nr:hypothetical protein SH412_002965 [Planctomycetaceae bacterium SH412]
MADVEMTVNQLDWHLRVIENARDLLRRKGPVRATGEQLPFWWSRWALAAYLRGESHGLRYGKPLVGSRYDLLRWADAVDDWANGDPDIAESPPMPAILRNGSEVSA